MALAYDPTAMQNGYVGHFLLQLSKKKTQKHPYFTFELNSLANICGVQTLSSPHLVTNVYQTETFNSSKQANTSEASASICTGALSCKCVGIFKQLQDMRTINTHPLLPGSVFPLLPSLSRLTNADGACINAPLHTACQTCMFWLHIKKVWQCYSLTVRLSSAEAMCRARYGKIVDWDCFRRELEIASHSATNATGDAIPRDASFQLCFSSPLSQPSLLIVSLLSFCPAVMYPPRYFPSDFGCFWRHRCRPARYCRNVRILTCKSVCICSV